MVCAKELYSKWYDSPCTHPMRNEILSVLLSIDRSSFKLWSLMDFDKKRLSFASGQVQLTNGQAMDAAALLCRASLTRYVTIETQQAIPS